MPRRENPKARACGADQGRPRREPPSRAALQGQRRLQPPPRRVAREGQQSHPRHRKVRLREAIPETEGDVRPSAGCRSTAPQWWLRPAVVKAIGPAVWTSAGGAWGGSSLTSAFWASIGAARCPPYGPQKGASAASRRLHGAARDPVARSPTSWRPSWLPQVRIRTRTVVNPVDDHTHQHSLRLHLREQRNAKDRLHIQTATR